MPTITNKNRFVIDVPNLGGGRNTKDSNTLIADIEAVDIENFDFEERGALKKVDGSAKLAPLKIGLVDSYSESNIDTLWVLYAGHDTAQGQSFTGDDGILDSAKFYLKKYGSPTGYAVAKIYAHSGTFGNSSLPTGEALAISVALDVSTLSTLLQLITFNFIGANRIPLTNGTKYIVTIEYINGDSDNYILVGHDSSSPTHNGNICYYFEGWFASSIRDLCFYIYASDSTNPVNTLYEAIKSDGTSHLLAFCGEGIYVSTDGGATFSTLKTGLTANKKWSCYTYADNVIMVNGVDTNQIYDFTSVRAMGLTDPTTAPTLATGAAGLLTGNYYYRVSFIYSGSESNVGIASSVVAPSAQKVNVSVIPTGGTGCTQRKLYRTKAGGTVYYELHTINDNTTTTYTDNDVDDLLSWKTAPTNNTAPPISKFVIEKDERIFYILPDSSDFYYSELYKPELSKGTSYRTVGADDGGVLMGAAIYEGDMFFYKAKKITDSDGTYYVGHKTYQLSGTNPDPETGDWVIKIANNAVGGIAIDTIDYSVSEVLCLDDDGLYSLQRNRLLSTIVVDTLSLSNKIEPDFNKFNKYYLHNSSGRVFNHKYYLAVPGEGRTSNSEIHVLDFRAVQTKDGWLPAWSKIRGLVANCFAVFRNKLIYGGDNGYVYVIDDAYTYFDGAEIQAFFDSKYYDAEIFDATKIFKLLDINIKASAIWSFSCVVYVQKGLTINSYSFTKTNASSVVQHPLFGKSLFSRFTFGSGSTVSNLASSQKVRIKLGYLGELIKIRFQNIYANQDFSIQGFRIHGQYMRVK